MTRYAIHDDPPCQEPLDSNGMCPACNVIPDSQSVAFVEAKPEPCSNCGGPTDKPRMGWCAACYSDSLVGHGETGGLKRRLARVEAKLNLLLSRLNT